MKINPLIKYIGNKHRSAPSIIATFPQGYRTYYEPFAGSLAVLGHLRPKRAVVSDACGPLIEMWRLAKDKPRSLVESYTENWAKYQKDDIGTYEGVKARYNAAPNPHDFLFISRTCYGGVMRFRKDGYISTPMGPHKPIAPTKFASRLDAWHHIIRNTEFVHGDFQDIVRHAGANDVVYCDPPYFDTQKIIYGAQEFILKRLFAALSEAKSRGAFIALSIDGTKKSGNHSVPILPPDGLFEAESYLSLGGSMLKRFWRDGLSVDDEKVRDRLLLSASSSTHQSDLFAKIA